jgi:hypothetical protein
MPGRRAAMELNRHHYFFIGLVLLFLGIQFRTVEAYVLNEKSTNFIADKLGKSPIEEGNFMRQFLPANGPLPRRTVRPPEWLGWCLMSVGGVLILHSLAMPRPNGA